MTRETVSTMTKLRISFSCPVIQDAKDSGKTPQWRSWSFARTRQVVMGRMSASMCHLHWEVTIRRLYLLFSVRDQMLARWELSNAVGAFRKERLSYSPRTSETNYAT